MNYFYYPSNFSLDELKNRLEFLKDQGDLKVLDKLKSSSYGTSIEKYLGLKTNNMKKPDWGKYELKTSVSTTKKITLQTIKWNFLNNENLKSITYKYGKKHFSKHLQCPSIRLDKKLSYSAKNDEEIHINNNYEKERIELKYSNNILGYISFEDFEKNFVNKLKNLVHIIVEKNATDEDYFRIKESYCLKTPKFEKALKALESGDLSIDLQCFIIYVGSESEKPKTLNSKLFCKNYQKYANIYDEYIELI